MAYSGLAYVIPNDWRMLSLASALLGMSLLAVATFTPESPRWLYARGKGDDGMRILQSITGSTLELEITVSNPKGKTHSSGGIVQVLRLQPLMTLIQIVSWWDFFVRLLTSALLTLNLRGHFGAGLWTPLCTTDWLCLLIPLAVTSISQQGWPDWWNYQRMYWLGLWLIGKRLAEFGMQGLKCRKTWFLNDQIYELNFSGLAEDCLWQCSWFWRGWVV